MSKKNKALVLFSGGLDSILVVKILEKQGIKVKALSFKSYFFSVDQAEKSAEENDIDLMIVDFSKEHLDLVKNPKYGYGKEFNPCIDCHLLMLKKAKEVMKKNKFSFVATGEVLGQRPMSQNKKALNLIKKESSLNGYLLRPLSAKLLEETIPEKKGIIDRESLFDFSGKQRKSQMRLAKKLGIKKYPNPAGGCLLTDSEFGERLKDLFENCFNCDGNDIKLLKYGRHFWREKFLIIVGRDEKENKKIKKIAREKDVVVEMKEYPGPATLIRNYGSKGVSDAIIGVAKDLTQHYSTKARNEINVGFKLKNI